MEILYALEKIRFPALDTIMLLVTRFGEETAFLVAALTVFWCVDKRKGYYIMAVGFIGTMCSQFLKLLFAVPRPWVLDPGFSIVERAREAAAGYSFPSGHSQTAVGTFGAIAASTDKKWLRRVCIAIAVLVPFSRMYLGVHTPADVLAGSGLAVLLVYVLKPMPALKKEQGIRNIIGMMLVLSLGLLAFVYLHTFPEDMDAVNLESGMKNAYTMVGCITGVAVVYAVERKYVNFETKAIWWAQLLKVLAGLGTVLAIKESLRAPLEALLPLYPARAVRYFLIVVWAGIGWPSTFRILAKMGVKK